MDFLMISDSVCQKLSQGWTRVFHNEHRSPYAYGNSEWVGYDDVQSLTEKAAYIKEMGFGGAMFWVSIVFTC